MSSSVKTIVALLSITILINCGSKKQLDPNKKHFDQASDYNNYITTQFDEVNRLWNVSLTVMDDSTLIYQQLDSLIVASKNSVHNMDQLADYKGDTSYKHAARDYFQYMHDMANGSYRDAIKIGLMGEVSDSLHFEYISISNRIGAEKDTCINRLKAAQQRFSEFVSK